MNLREIKMTETTKLTPHPYSQVLQWVAEGKAVEAYSGGQWIPAVTSGILNAANHFGHGEYYQPEDFRLKPQRHIHQELIDAYRAGAEIQIRALSEGSWYDCDPQWAENRLYRIKPEPKPDITEYITNTMTYGWKQDFKHHVGAEVLKVIRCGETHKLKSVEII